jgi:hypothetical protein
MGTGHAFFRQPRDFENNPGFKGKKGPEATGLGISALTGIIIQ